MLSSHLWFFTYLILCFVAKSWAALCEPMDCIAHQAPLPVGFFRQNTGGGCHFLLQGIFPTQGLKLHLLLGRCILYRFTN